MNNTVETLKIEAWIEKHMPGVVPHFDHMATKTLGELGVEAPDAALFMREFLVLLDGVERNEQMNVLRLYLGLMYFTVQLRSAEMRDKSIITFETPIQALSYVLETRSAAEALSKDFIDMIEYSVSYHAKKVLEKFTK